MDGFERTPDVSWSSEDFMAYIVKLQGELDHERQRNEDLTNETKRLRETAINIQQKGEFEEEFIVNSLVKRVTILKKEKEQLLEEVKREEEYLANTLQRRLESVRDEKIELEKRLEAEQEFIVNRLQKQLAVVIEEKVRLQKRLSKETKQDRADRLGTSASTSESESDKDDGRDRFTGLSKVVQTGDNLENQSAVFEHMSRTIDLLRRELRKSRRELNSQKEISRKEQEDKITVAIKLRRLMNQQGGAESPRSQQGLSDSLLDQEVERIMSSIGKTSPQAFARSVPISIASNKPETSDVRKAVQSSRNPDSLGSSHGIRLGQSYTTPVGSPLSV